MLHNIFFKGLTPDPLILLSDWADENRVLTSEFAAEYGRYRTDRYPYLREIQDELSPSRKSQHIVVKKPVQAAVSTIGENWFMAIAHIWPGPALAVFPTDDLCKRFSKKRFAPSIAAMPCLEGIIVDPAKRDSKNTMLLKEFPGGSWRFCSSNSGPALRSDAIRFLWLDDRNGYVSDVNGEGEGGALALKRTDSFPNRKIFENSTPTNELGRIEKSYETSSQAQCFIPCPKCNHYQTLQWGNLKFKRIEIDNLVDKNSIYYECENCKNHIKEEDKKHFLPRYKWIHKYPDREKLGYWFNGLYYPLGKISWADIINEFLEANEALKKNDPSLMKVWQNCRMAESWEEIGEEADGIAIYNRREVYESDCPGLVLTCGADVQGDRIECEVVAWSENFESWSIDYKIFRGNPAEWGIWRQFSDFLRQARYGGLKIQCTAIDTGYMADQVCKFVATYNKYIRLIAIKGSSAKWQPILKKSATVDNKYETPRYQIGTDTAKDLFFKRLQITEPGPGFCHFPAEYEMEYFDMLTAEKCIIKYVKGFPVREWVKKESHIRNEALDVRIYNMAAVIFLNPVFEAIRKKIENQDIDYEIEPAKPIKKPNLKKKIKKLSAFKSGYM